MIHRLSETQQAELDLSADELERIFAVSPEGEVEARRPLHHVVQIVKEARRVDDNYRTHNIIIKPPITIVNPEAVERVRKQITESSVRYRVGENATVRAVQLVLSTAEATAGSIDIHRDAGRVAAGRALADILDEALAPLVLHYEMIDAPE